MLWAFLDALCFLSPHVGSTMNATDVLFLILLPTLAVVLIFALLLYLSRGRRRISLNLSGFGVKLSVDSTTAGEQGAVNATE